MTELKTNIITTLPDTVTGAICDPLPCNWRDVGLSLSLYCSSSIPFIPCGKLLRCGLIGHHHRRADLGLPNTIMNIRTTPDEHKSQNPTEWDGVTFLHIPSVDALKTYNTANQDVIDWLNLSLRAIEKASPPILIHCRSGKDRTGVLVAAVLMALGVPEKEIIKEYGLSIGTGIGSHLIQLSVQELRSSQPAWLRGVNVSRLRSSLCGRCTNHSTFHENKLKSAEIELRYINKQLLNLRELHIRTRQKKSNIHSFMACFTMPVSCAIIELAARKVVLLQQSLKIDATGRNSHCGALKELCFAYSRQGGAFFNLQSYASAHRSYDLAIEAGRQCPDLSIKFLMRLSRQRQNCLELIQDNVSISRGLI